MAESPNTEPALVRGLGLMASTSIVVGTVIGTGIFLKTRVMMCNVESAWLVIAAWLAAGLLSLAGALTYAELSSMMPHAGGEYLYIREGYGPLPAFLYGWTQFAVAYTGSQAAKGVSFAIFLGLLVGHELDVRVIAIAMIILATLANCLPVAKVGWISVLLTGLKIGIVLAIGAGAFWLARGSWEHFAQSGSGGVCDGVALSARAGSAGILRGFGAAMLGALWAFDGWTNVTQVAGEVKAPQRTLPLALIGGMVTVIALYLFANLAYLHVLSPIEIASISPSSSVAAEVARKFLGPSALSLIAMAMMISTLGSLHTGTMAGARISYAMAKDGLFFKMFAEVSRTSRVPIVALCLQGLWSCALVLTGSFDKLTDYVMFASWIFYGLNAASLFIFRLRVPHRERPYRALGYPVLPILFLLTTAWLLFSTILATPREACMGLAIIALGLPIYGLRFRSPLRPTLSGWQETT